MDRSDEDFGVLDAERIHRRSIFLAHPRAAQCLGRIVCSG
jgi:hypothetical protein